jgi:branched-chain amino acid transport system substrate-binding protein
LLLFGIGCASRKPPEPIWIGHVAPLTGPDRRAGQQARQGILLAVEEARAADLTVAGRPVAVRHADDRGELEAARAETVRLLAVNKVAALIAGPAGRTAALLQAARPYATPVVVPAEVVGPLSGEPVLVLGAPPATRGKALAEHALRSLQAKRAAILHDEKSAVCGAVVDAFTGQWPARGVTHFSVEQAAPDLVKSIVAGKPDVVVLAVESRELGRWLRRLRAEGWRGPILHGGEDVGTDALRREAPLGPDLRLVTVCDREGLTEEGKAFAKRYEERFREPPELAAVQAHDAARLLFDVLREADSAQAQRVREAVKARTTFESLLGPVSWHERQPRRRLFVVRLSKDRARVVRTIPAEE